MRSYLSECEFISSGYPTTPTNGGIGQNFGSCLKEFPSDTDKINKSGIKIFSESWFLIR
jgi:hypothetical protein